MVFLFKTVPWMHDAIRELPVVGEQEQTRRVSVQPAHGVDTLRHLHDVHDCPAIALVSGRGDIATRFVEQDITLRLGPDELAVDADLRPLRVDLGTELCDHPPIHGDAARADKLLRFAP
ncbi:MAG: hypothetical protein KatS3mg059_0531 [Thermomicrobiales bacterium]|nr:MAG: hypothetical protein KatS3mg059_0531 [Thermomicrobiales bacterium]